MGEGCANDATLMDYVSSVNIACGFHAGDAATMRKTVETAVEKGVAIGAHPGFADAEGFGRREFDVSHQEVYDIVTEQINTFGDICRDAGATMAHVKPHGALYNMAARNSEMANAIAMAVKAIDDRLVLFGLSGSLLISEAEACGLATASEVFADRTYSPDGSLTPRSRPDALIHDSAAAVAQVLQMVGSKTVTALDGTTIPITADTVCIHGDGENAVAFAASINKVLIDRAIEIRPIRA